MSGEQQFDQMIWAIINYKKSKKKKKIVKIEKKEKKEKKEEREQSKTRPKGVRFAAETENAPPASAANLSGLSLQLQVVPRRQSPREQLAHPPRGPSCRPVHDFTETCDVATLAFSAAPGTPGRAAARSPGGCARISR